MSEQALDQFHWHEALDRAHMLAEMFEAHLASHPVIEQTHILKVRAETVAELLRDLYQEIGRATPDGSA